jgi:hypothetical protein
MDVLRIISELRLQRDHIQQAILSLERLDRPRTGVTETAAESRTELRTVRGADAGS